MSAARLFKLGALGAMLVLAGCGANMNYVMTTYSGVKHVAFASPTQGKTFRMYDLPDQNKVMITPSLSDAAGMGFSRGITLGMVPNTVNPESLTNAGIEWLATTGRTCRLVSVRLLLDPQYEMSYACDVPAVASAT